MLGLVLTGAQPLYGANALWYGSIAAVTWLDRNRPMSLFGVLPMTAQQFLLLLVGISLLMFLTTKNETAFVGDLGALAGGIAMANWLRRPRKPKKPPERKKARASGFKVIQGGQDDRNLLH
jgi:membrane associated rhomboid family serine protease